MTLRRNVLFFSEPRNVKFQQNNILVCFYEKTELLVISTKHWDKAKMIYWI